MSQAKGILPRDEDRDFIYRSALTCDYLAAVTLDPSLGPRFDMTRPNQQLQVLNSPLAGSPYGAS